MAWGRTELSVTPLSSLLCFIILCVRCLSLVTSIWNGRIKITLLLKKAISYYHEICLFPADCSRCPLPPIWCKFFFAVWVWYEWIMPWPPVCLLFAIGGPAPHVCPVDLWLAVCLLVLLGRSDCMHAVWVQCDWLVDPLNSGPQWVPPSRRLTSQRSLHAFLTCPSSKLHWIRWIIACFICHGVRQAGKATYVLILFEIIFSCLYVWVTDYIDEYKIRYWRAPIQSGCIWFVWPSIISSSARLPSRPSIISSSARM